MTGNENRTKRRLALAALATALAAAATVQVASGVAKTGAAMGSLTFEAALAMRSMPGPCPPGSPPDADLCAAQSRPRQQQVRDVGAGNQQHERDHDE